MVASINSFTPKLVSMWNEGYGRSAFRADALAGLTVAIVALPLSMAIAIASHVSPDRGLFTAIIGGFVISALGGSRFQIGGPAGAFIVLIASIVDRHGIDGLLLATFMAGAIIFSAGLLRLGSYIKYVPHVVTVSFTFGIALIIFASQLKELLGLSLQGPEPSAFFPKLSALADAVPSLNIEAVALSCLTIATIMLLRKFKPNWPAFLIAVVLASVLAWAAHFNAATIASRFGGIPHGLAAPHLPPINFGLVVGLLPDALSLALLGSIESLLSAVVADRMSNRNHRSNMELIAQGTANMACAIFGGIVATGTIARTATNVRAGAHGPVAGILHSVFILLFVIVAAPLAGYIPLSALAGILVVVCWGMADKAEVLKLLQSSYMTATILLITLVLTLIFDLMTGIVTGTALYYAAQYFLRRPNRQP
jgi:sulfate permease, SulP family